MTVHNTKSGVPLKHWSRLTSTYCILILLNVICKVFISLHNFEIGAFRSIKLLSNGSALTLNFFDVFTGEIIFSSETLGADITHV